MVAASSSSAPAAQVLFDVSNFPKAADFLNAVLSGKYKVVCYGGAIRGGKTFSSLGALTLLHKRFPGSRSIIVRDSLTTLKMNVLPSIDKAFPSNFIKQHNATDFWWQFTNGSFTKFVSENIKQDPELKAWNGLEFNFCLLEQSEELQERTFFKALERLGSYMMPRGLTQPPPVLMVTVNPTDTWARKWFYEPYLAGTLPEGWLYIPARIDDNPHIAESYKESLLMMKHANPIHYEKFVSGNWDAKESTGNEFYPRFERGKHTGQVPYLPGLPIWQSWDANSLPYCAMFCAQIEDKRSAGGPRTLRVFQEYAIGSPNSGLRNTGRAFLRDRLKNGWQDSAVMLTGDASLRARKPSDERSTAFDDVLAALNGYDDPDGKRVPGCLNAASAARWPKRNPEVMRRRDFVNYLLAGGFPDIAVQIDAAACPKLVADMGLVQLGDAQKLKEMYNDPVLGVRYQKLGHMSDDFDYICCTVFEPEYLAFKAGRGG